MTVTFHKMKRGMPKREDLCGKIFVEKIGIPPEAEMGVL
jgi:NAD(P)H-hydrate epimerase